MECLEREDGGPEILNKMADTAVVRWRARKGSARLDGDADGQRSDGASPFWAG